MYATFFIFLILGGFLFSKAMGKPYLFMVVLFLLIIIGFRSPETGSDTESYIRAFERMGGMRFGELQYELQRSREPLYTFLTWLCRSLTSSYVFYLFVCALFPCVAIYYILRDELKYPKDYMVAILCLFALGLFAFFVAGIRQTAAISLVFLGYRYLKKIDISFSLRPYLTGNALKFALCIAMALMFHNSSLLFLLALPFLKLKIRWWVLPVVVSLFFVGSFFKIGFIVQIAAVLFADRFATYGTVYESSQSINGFVMQFILFLICFFQYVKLREKDRTNTYLFNLVLAGMVCQSFSGMLYEMSRAAYYFSIFFLILVPRAMKEYPSSMRQLIYPGFSLLLLVYLFALATAQLPPYSSSLF